MKGKMVLALAVVLGIGLLYACGSDEYGCDDICKKGNEICDWGEDTSTCTDSCNSLWDQLSDDNRADAEECFNAATTCEEFMTCTSSDETDGD